MNPLSAEASISAPPTRAAEPFEVVWHPTAPDEVREAQATGERPKMWVFWQEHLRRRRRPRPLMQLVGKRQFPLLWGVPDELNPGQEPTPTLAERVGKLIQSESRSTRRWRELAKGTDLWLQDLEVSPIQAEQARDALAVAHALPTLANLWDASTWFEALQTLVSIARDSAAADGSLHPLAWQLWSGELPLTLAYLFPEIETCRQLGEPAGHALSSGMSELLDDAGVPRSLGLAEIPQLVACWTRCHALVDHVAEGRWDDSAQQRYRELVRNLMRLLRDADECLLTPQETRRVKLAELVSAASKVCGDRTTRRLAKAVLRGKSPRKKPLESKVSPALHAHGAKLAVLRPRWSAHSPRLAVRYHGREFAVELCCGGDTILSGLVESSIVWNRQQLTPTGHWLDTCWVSDAKADYLELELPLAEGMRLERQLLLSRRDGFLLWLDAVLGAEEEAPRGTIESCLSLPLEEGVEFRGEDKTCEGYLVGTKPRARVLPLALGEWRSEARFGRLETTGATLDLHQAAHAASGLLMPLFIDLDAKRRKLPCTWRRLTVAEDREVVPHDVAGGFRAQVGDEQWLIYRSLVNRNSRTLLGHHLLHEFLAARFTSQGQVEPLLAIESEWGTPE